MTFYFAFYIYLRYRHLKLCFLISKQLGIFLIILLNCYWDGNMFYKISIFLKYVETL